MTWHLYTPHTHDSNLGKVASVFLNEDHSLIKRYFIPKGVTTHGEPTKESAEYIEEKWNNEWKALTRFEHFDWVPELVEINHKHKYIIQRYYGPCLLYQQWDDIPDLHKQIIDIYTYFKEIDVYKLNGSLANTTRKDDKLIMFDFKFMCKREPVLVEHAEREIDLWLKKFGQSLVPTLKALI